jgi:hypothetical protein
VNPTTSEMILFGGEHFDGKLTRFFNDLYRIDLKKDKLSWKRYSSSNAPSPRSSHQAIITPSQQMFLFGGNQNWLLIISYVLTHNVSRRVWY